MHPETRANELSSTQLEAIRFRVTEVVKVACEANSDHDLFPDDWLFHHRWGKTDGAKVNGDAIKFIEVGGRTTAFVPKLQLKTAIKPEIKTEIKTGADDGATKAKKRSKPSGVATRAGPPPTRAASNGSRHHRHHRHRARVTEPTYPTNKGIILYRTP